MTTQSYMLIDVNTKNGKKFQNKTTTLISDLFNSSNAKAGANTISKFNEKTRFFKSLTAEQLESNNYLCKIFDTIKNNGDGELKEMFKNLQLKNVSVGLFGRTAGYTNRTIADPHFRFFVHFGDPEIYYFDSEYVLNEIFY